MAGRCGTVAWLLSVWEIDFTNTKDTLAKKELRYRLAGTTYFLLYLARHTIPAAIWHDQEAIASAFFPKDLSIMHAIDSCFIWPSCERLRKSYRATIESLSHEVRLWSHTRDGRILNAFCCVVALINNSIRLPIYVTRRGTVTMRINLNWTP